LGEGERSFKRRYNNDKRDKVTFFSSWQSGDSNSGLISKHILFSLHQALRVYLLLCSEQYLMTLSLEKVRSKPDLLWKKKSIWDSK
jgi:hypothetical protein